MSANLVQDWLQIAAGLSALLGVIFLATGVFGKDDAKFYAPILGALIAGIWYGFLAFLISGWAGADQWMAIAVATGVGLIVSVGLYFTEVSKSAKESSDRDESTLITGENIENWGELVAFSVLQIIAFLFVCAVIIGLGNWVFHVSSQTVWAIIFLPVLGTVATVSLSAAPLLSERILKGLGLLFSIVSIALFLAPSIADLVGTPVK
jgi:hypothetical protein